MTARITRKKILVVVEEAFARICHALLELRGYAVVEAGESNAGEMLGGCDLLIASYPGGREYLARARFADCPVIVLSNGISSGLVSDLEGLSDVHCLIKPLNFEEFFLLVAHKINGTGDTSGGISIG